MTHGQGAASCLRPAEEADLVDGMNPQVAKVERTIPVGHQPLGVGREVGNAAGATLPMPVTWVGSYVRELGGEVGHLSRGRWTNVNSTHTTG